MKKRIVVGIFEIIAGLLIAVGPHTIFHVCRPEGDMLMNCNYTSYAESFSGAFIVLIGIFTLFFKKNLAQIIFSAVAAVLSALAFSFPTFLIGVCENAHMHCHAVALPSLVIISSVLFAVSVINIIYSIVKRKKYDEA